MTISTLRGGPRASLPGSERRGSRLLGGGTAAVIAIAANVIAFTVDAPGPFPQSGLPYLALGIPAAALVGAWLGPTVGELTGARSAAFLMAVATIPVADAFVVLAVLFATFFATPTTVDPAGPIVALGAIWLIGLVLVGLPMLVVTAPCAIVWALLVRATVRRGAEAVA